jgi:hypothetical protein
MDFEALEAATFGELMDGNERKEECEKRRDGKRGAP